MKKNNYCSNCGTKLEGDVNFCPECGNNIGANNDQSKKEGTAFSKKNMINYVSKDAEFHPYVAHGAVALVTILFSFIGIFIFEMITDSLFGYYTPWIVETIGMFLVTFGLVALIGIFITVYAIKLNLLIINKEKIGWDDILLKKVDFKKNIPSAIASYLLVILIDSGVILVSIFMSFMLIENYQHNALPFLRIVSSIILIVINSRLIFSQFIVFDQNEKAVKSLKKSYNLTQESILKVIGSIILISIINIIGGFLVVGVFITFPISIYLLTKLYFDLKKTNLEEAV
ncbi:MAG: zinc-ribbon domain-containing protein [Bacillota bacterium]